MAGWASVSRGRDGSSHTDFSGVFEGAATRSGNELAWHRAQCIAVGRQGTRQWNSAARRQEVHAAMALRTESLGPITAADRLRAWRGVAARQTRSQSALPKALSTPRERGNLIFSLSKQRTWRAWRLGQQWPLSGCSSWAGSSGGCVRVRACGLAELAGGTRYYCHHVQEEQVGAVARGRPATHSISVASSSSSSVPAGPGL